MDTFQEMNLFCFLWLKWQLPKTHFQLQFKDLVHTLLEIWVNMQHKNVHPITWHNKISTVMKALHSVREDKSQLFERKVRQETTACIAQLNTKKTQKVTHSWKRNKKLFVLSIGLFLVTKILLDIIVKPPLSDRKITLCMSCS